MTVQIRGNLAEVEFRAPFDLERYELFLRTKKLPESQISFDWEADSYRLTTPARFAALLGSGSPPVRTQGLPLAEHLFDYQAWAVKLALEAERFALWLDTGLGKTPVMLEWCRQVLHRTSGKVLIIAPIGLFRQHIAEAARFYGESLPIERLDTREALAHWCAAAGDGLAITNYEKFIPDILPELRHLAGLAADECFAKGTQINTPSGRKHIETCKIGDEIYNASGVDIISDVHRREVPFAIRITVRGHPIVSSPNHPYLTRRGWVCAQDIVPGDQIMATAEAMRMVRGDVHSESSRRGGETILRSILLSEMADEPARALSEGPQSSGGVKTRRQEAGLVRRGLTRGRGGTGTDPHSESDVQSRDAPEGFPPIESDEARTFRAWGQREWFDEASSDLAGCTRTDVGGGISFVTGQIDSRLSVALQARLGRARAANQYRGGWALPPQSEGSRWQERREGEFSRVDRLEVLEPGHPDLERLRDADGKLYFYDLGGTRHPSFSVNGLLVHNSSILKTGGGKIKWNLIKSARGIPFKLSCTATPAPNEAMEYASQAAFLEKLRTEGEILWTYFTKTETGYVIKPHARAAFYAFMASWSLYMRDPARFGFADILSMLPPAEHFEYALPITDEQRRIREEVLSGQADAGMFDDDRLGVKERSRLAQAARGFLYSGGAGKSRKVLRLPSRKPTMVADLADTDVRDGRQVLVWTVFEEEGEVIWDVLDELQGRRMRAAILTGSQSEQHRAEILERFRRGDLEIVISKPQLMGYGLNLQHVRSMIFSGIDDSFERRYQAERRAVRFGQTEVVRVHEPYIPELEGMMFSNVARKEQRFIDDVALQERFYREALADRLGGAVS